jgi:drug/metabolite transporter (DMT)-like permease
MRALRKIIAPIIFFVALIYLIGTPDAWGNGQISTARAALQCAVCFAVMWVILRAGRCV